MAKKVGEIKVIIKDIYNKKKEVRFEIYYLKNAFKGSKNCFDALHHSYWVVMTYNSQTFSKNLGQMLLKIKELKDYRKGKIIKNTLSKEVINIAKKEAIVLNL